MLRNKLSNHTEVLKSIKDEFSDVSVRDSGNINSPMIGKLFLQKISREKNLEKKNNITIVKPNTSTTTFTVTYTGLRELLPPYNKKGNTLIIKPNFTNSCSQSQSVQQITKESTEFRELDLKGAIADSFSIKGVQPAAEKVDDSLSKLHNPGNIMNSDILAHAQNETSTDDNVRDKIIECDESIVSKNSPLESMSMSECSTSISKPLTDAKEKPFHGKETFKTHFQMINPSLRLQEAKFICCVLCKSSFSSISSLRKHLGMFHCADKDRRKCPYCNYRCYQTSDLGKHIARRHTRNFKYKCLYCTKGFTTPSELKKHNERKHFKKKQNK